MRFKTGSGLLQMAALAIIAGPLAQAQDSGWYVGANAGPSRSKIDDIRIPAGLQGAGFYATSLTDHNNSGGFKVFGGYEFTRWLSLEGGYFNLGHFSYNATTLPPGTLDGELKLQGMNLDLVFSLPLSKKFSVFARGGGTYARVKDTFTGTGRVEVLDASPSKSAFNYKFGGGLQYQFTPTVGMRAEGERYRINDAVGNRGDIDLFSLGLIVRFGRHAPAPAPAPVPEAQAAVLAPEPVEPVVVIVPVQAPTQQYCTILDLQFDIDRDDILREDREKLAVVGTFLAKYPGTTAVIEGHSDNVGSDDHNMRLSQRRAESVVTYLVDTLHIERSRLSAVGYGDTRPLADNSTQEGKRKNRRIDAVIACVTDVAGLTVVPARMTMALLIEFDSNQTELKPEYDSQLSKVATFLKVNPSVTATVEGHTGNLKASPERAMEISRLRAQTVVNALVDRFGVDRSRLSAQGYGSDRRFAYNTSLEGQQENRRVNIIINYPK